MGLKIYREVSAGVYAAYRVYGETSDSLPIVTTHDGVLGGVVETKLFLRNDSALEYFTDITIQAICLTSPDETDGVSTGHGTKLSAGDTQPTEAVWEDIDYGNILSLDDIGAPGAGDTSTYLPFWYRVECPAGAPADNRENITLRVFYTSNLV